MKQVLKFLDKHLEEYLIAILLIALTLIMLLQIVMRYVFNNSLSWPEELSRYCFVYITFLTLGYCVRNDSMLRLDILKELLPSKIWTVLQAIVRIVSLIFSVHVCEFTGSAGFDAEDITSQCRTWNSVYLYLSVNGIGIWTCGYPWSPDDCGTGDRVF